MPVAPGTSNVVPLPTREGSKERVVGSDGLRVASSFGAADTTFGMAAKYMGADYAATQYYGGERAREFDYRAAFYTGRQHDWRIHDMNGRLIGPKELGNFEGAQGMLSAASEETYIPIAVRRPNVPYRLARIIVKAFTGLLFGHNRWPQIRSTDPVSQAFAEACVEAANFRNCFHRSRNIGGSSGTSAISWRFAKGQPKLRVHQGRMCTVLEWEDVDEFIPRHVTELYQTTAIRRGVDKHGRQANEAYQVWVRRDWTPEADLVFHPVEVTGEDPSEWSIDEERSVFHGDGEAHIVWIPNFPDDEDPGSVDGTPDYDTLYEQLNGVDELNSIVFKGVLRNVDPTLVLGIEKEEYGDTVVRKGSDNSLMVGSGNASYLTIPADVVNAGKLLLDMHRSQVLEAAQMVIPDPDKVAAAGTSSVAMKMLYAMALNATDLLRDPSGKAITLLLSQMQRSARRRMGSATAPPEILDTEVLVEEPANDDGEAPEEETFDNEELAAPEDQDPDEVAVEYFFDMPDRVVREQELGPDGQPTGREIQRFVPIKPGDGNFTLEWGDYFPPTADDKQKATGAFSTATGGKPVMSQASAAEGVAVLYNKDPIEEVKRLAQERKQAHDNEQGLFPELTPSTDAAPPGTTPAVDPVEKVAPLAADGDDLITPSDMAAIVKVNEARIKKGLGILLLPDGTPDSNGDLTVAAYRALMEAQGAAAGTAAVEPPVEEVPAEPTEPTPDEPVLPDPEPVELL